MKKLNRILPTYLLVFLIVQLNSSVIFAEAASDEVDGKKVVLFSEEIDGEIDLYQEEDMKTVLFSIPDETKVTLLEFDNAVLSLILYTYIDDDGEEQEIEGFVPESNIVDAKDEVQYREERLKKLGDLNEETDVAVNEKSDDNTEEEIQDDSDTSELEEGNVEDKQDSEDDGDKLETDNPVTEIGNTINEQVNDKEKEYAELKDGDRDERVILLKSNLEKLGFQVPGKGTSLYGTDTTKKVKEFQKYYGLEQTGTLTEETEIKIEQILSSPLQSGKKHPDTVQLKKNLALLGFLVPGKGTTLFGKDTETKVKAFQKANGLVVNGIADEITLTQIEELKNTPLTNGMRREDVKTLKIHLEKLGFKVPGKGTNLYGAQTEAKVKAFQKYYGIKQTGTVTEETQLKMEQILSSPLQSSKKHQDTVQLKKDLAFLGYPVPGKGTTLFGADTEKKVKAFQKANGLTVNGIADQVTLDKIKEIKNAPLSNGMRREDVKQLKKELGSIGFKVPGKGTNLYGAQTEEKVKAFQQYYGIKQTGNVTKETQLKLDEILSSSLQEGKRHSDTVKLKKDLQSIGFKVPGNGTTLYGSQTAKKVSAFQKYYGLTVNGIADEVTLKEIKRLLGSPLQNGKKHKDTIALKKDLKAVGFSVPGKGTSLYGSDTEKKVREFQKYYGLTVNGIADNVTLSQISSILNSPLQKGKKHKKTVKLKKDLAKLGYAVPGKGTSLYGKGTEKQVKAFQKAKKLKVNGIADEVTLARIEKELKKVKPVKPIKIFIDAGHGGSDPGAGGFGLSEKNLTLDIAKRLEKYLKKYAGIELKLSRTTDKTVSLAERTKKANDWGADYFVSTHINSCCGGTGFESYIHNGKRGTADAKAKQDIIHNKIAKDINVKDRGKKTANFHVLRESNMSAILLEYLFIDTKKDNDKLKQSSFIDKLAKATAEGIASAYKLKKK